MLNPFGSKYVKNIAIRQIKTDGSKLNNYMLNRDHTSWTNTNTLAGIINDYELTCPQGRVMSGLSLRHDEKGKIRALRIHCTEMLHYCSLRARKRNHC